MNNMVSVICQSVREIWFTVSYGGVYVLVCIAEDTDIHKYRSMNAI